MFNDISTIGNHSTTNDISIVHAAVRNALEDLGALSEKRPDEYGAVQLEELRGVHSHSLAKSVEESVRLAVGLRSL